MLSVIISLILAGGGIFVLNAYVQPEFLEVQRIRSEQAVVEDAIDNAREVIRLRDELLDKYNKINPADIDKIRKFLPANSALSNLFIDIQTMASQAGIHISDISFAENEPPPEYLPEVGSALTLQLKVDGSYEQFLSFLGVLEKNIRLIDVTEIKLGQESDEGTISFDLKLQTYYQERTIL